MQQTTCSTSHKLVNGVLLKVWERGLFSNLARSTSREPVNGAVLEA
jgi:hypothetical protein